MYSIDSFLVTGLGWNLSYVGISHVQGLDGEATEPMIKELEDDREEAQDPEVEFAIAGVMQECGGLEIVVNMVQVLDWLECPFQCIRVGVMTFGF